LLFEKENLILKSGESIWFGESPALWLPPAVLQLAIYQYFILIQ